MENYNESSGNSYNTAVGARSAQALTTGRYNVFIGALCGDSETTGQRSTAVGYSALQNQNFTG